MNTAARTGRIAGKVAFITGAARGQGRAHAIRLAEEGADIIALDLCADIDGMPYSLAGEDDLAETVSTVEAAGGRIHAEVADVRNFDSLAGVLARGVEKFGHLDIVCANVGINIPAPTHELTESHWGTVIDVDLSGVWRTAKAAIPYLIEQGTGGAIILTSSAAGLKGYGNIAHYTAAKHGVNGLMKTLAQELAPHRVRVNTVNPTQVDTPMIMNDAMYRLFCPGLDNPTREDFAPLSQAMNALPIPWVESVDVSNAVLFLASEEARYITGVALPVDAGVLVK
ncbi:mycofactocin-coupled SDR family oxidoreductase [Rhodococcus sp. IEGM 1318]|uniref:mycofactocin-coupled SDR family oxidoreductase n=1 Tax=Rhodococcus sp. IEGM 1318 TaxID=3082226 RepID=UPI0029537F1B|nr:mycofactocin-coupled SDR family oxidoreductase [Rhodococcus sp. IEGM 1318]MDV8008993.1 mycofactocin-coupled SDR family oxidoreductase [Rhodococcus sp. IEGM 1318]